VPAAVGPATTTRNQTPPLLVVKKVLLLAYRSLPESTRKSSRRCRPNCAKKFCAGMLHLNQTDYRISYHLGIKSTWMSLTHFQFLCSKTLLRRSNVEFEVAGILAPLLLRILVELS
jgi:hypothetical protein